MIALGAGLALLAVALVVAALAARSVVLRAIEAEQARWRTVDADEAMRVGKSAMAATAVLDARITDLSRDMQTLRKDLFAVRGRS